MAGLNHSYVFHFERDFEQSSIKGWMEQNWLSLCSLATAGYLAFIFGVQAYMKDRTPFNLRTTLAVWSFSLATFSIFGALRIWTEFLQTITNQGMYYSVCSPSFIAEDKVAGLWTWLFVLSKLPELVDTAFIVLRKQKLIFLHWYHHVTVLWICWYSYIEFTSTCRWFMVMNYSVHAIMYSYYTLKALKYPVPKPFAMVITTLQLLQMVGGCIINCMAYSYKQNGMKCSVSDNNLRFCFLLYFSYFILFARFFYNSYFKSNSLTLEKKKIVGQEYAELTSKDRIPTEYALKANQDLKKKN